MGFVRTVLGAAVAFLSAATCMGAAIFSVLPQAEHDATVPTLESVIGHGWGDEISDPAQIDAYARALAMGSDRVRLVEYARSLEGRPLLLLVLSDPANLERIDKIKGDLARLGDPRGLEEAEAETLLGSLPAVVWLACSVHGDEASGGEAGIALAYHLAAGRSPEIEEILRDSIVIVDPMQNPDGRARFVASTRQARGAVPDGSPSAAEHVQPWPGGRYSHDLFDLNRDWFALTHPESVGRVRAMNEWLPAVVVDLHEMGAEMGYFFAPPAAPHNPLVSVEQSALWELVGRANAAAFDAHGWRYWTREIFDAFYPGYGETWPFFSGAVGMTYEQASSRGLVTRLEDGSLLTYVETVRHQLTAAYTTCRVTAENRRRFLSAWRTYRALAVSEGRRGPTRAFLLEPGAAPSRAAALAGLLARQGIEVERVTIGGKGIVAGSFLVRLDQPLGRLARTLLAKSFGMGEEFEKEQERRWSKRLPDQIYDITAWSLPLLWGVPTRELEGIPTGLDQERVSTEWAPSGSVAGPAKVAYLLPWNDVASARATAVLLRAGVKLRVATKAFVVRGSRFEPGTVVIRRAENDDALHERLAQVARGTGVEVTAVDSGYVDEGIDLGSSSVRLVKPPAIAVAWDAPTRPTSAGATRHAIERIIGYPVTAFRARSLAYARLDELDVIVLPDAGGDGEGYLELWGESGVKRLTSWVRDGGVLIGIGGGAVFLCQEKVGLLSSRLETLGEEGGKRVTKDDGEGRPSQPPTPPTYEERVRPDKESPPPVPGSIVAVGLDTEHLLAAGFPTGTIDVLVNSRRSFIPLKLDDGTNVGIYAQVGSLLRAGFMLEASRRQLPQRAYFMEEPLGRGRVIGFAEEPAFRGFTRGTLLLLANAVFFGPAL